MLTKIFSGCHMIDGMNIFRIEVVIYVLFIFIFDGN